MAASTAYTKKMDHQYCRYACSDVTNKVERCPSYFGSDHVYSKPQTVSPKKTPVKNDKRKRDQTTPTGKTPRQPLKLFVASDKHIKKTSWTEEEKQYVKDYVHHTPRGQESLTEYWESCAVSLNIHFQHCSRNGHACKSLAQRMFIVPASVSPDTCNMSSQSSSDATTQTDLSLPVDNRGEKSQRADWVCIEPKKELKECASQAAQTVHRTATKRLRQYAPMTDAEKACLIDVVSNGTPRQIARTAMGILPLGEEIKNMFLFDIEMDARECSNKGSVLYCKNYDNLLHFKWENIMTEIVNKQQLLAEVLLAVALPKERIGNTSSTEGLVPVLGMTYGILMKQRYYPLNGVQKIVSTTLANEQTHQQVYDRLQPLGISLSHQGMLDNMTSISGSFNNKLIDCLKLGKRFRIVGDNVNFHVGIAKERKSVGKTGHMQHWFSSAAIVQNLTFPYLCNNGPQCDLRQLPTQKFIMCETDWQDITYSFSVLSSRVLVEFFPWLKPAKSVVNDPIAVVPEDLKKKNHVIPLPVMHKNEQKYADVVDILVSYQELCENTYRAAEKDLEKVHVGGDQLTRERFSDAKKLRAAALTETERLEALNPVTFELFHLQMAVLTLFYQVLYDERHTDVFTLHSQKVRLMRKDANGNDVKNHYDSCRELTISVVKAYIVQAALEYYDLTNTNEKPDFVPDLQHMSEDQIKDWLVTHVSPIINKVTSVSRGVVDGSYVEEPSLDMVHSYGNILVELGLVFLELCDIVKSPNRQRLITCLKYLMLILKGHNNKSKYALEILRFLCQQFALLSEQRANETVYGLFVNTGKTIIPADLQMEHLVRVTKTHLRSMCSIVTDQSLVKRSSAFFGMNEISAVFDEETSVIKRSQKHKRISSVEDECKVLNDLKSVKPFFNIPGRQAESLNKIPRNPISKLSMPDFIKWINFYQVKFYFEL